MLGVGAEPPVPVLLDGVDLVHLVLAEAVGCEMCRAGQRGDYQHDHQRDAAQLSEGNGEAERRARRGRQDVSVGGRGGHLTFDDGKRKATGASGRRAPSLSLGVIAGYGGLVPKSGR